MHPNNRSISQIPHYICPISHNTSIRKKRVRYVHISRDVVEVITLLYHTHTHTDTHHTHTYVCLYVCMCFLVSKQDKGDALERVFTTNCCMFTVIMRGNIWRIKYLLSWQYYWLQQVRMLRFSLFERLICDYVWIYTMVSAHYLLTGNLTRKLKFFSKEKTFPINWPTVYITYTFMSVAKLLSLFVKAEHNL